MTSWPINALSLISDIICFAFSCREDAAEVEGVVVGALAFGGDGLPGWFDSD
ncbi:hypothetical protein ACU063_01030 [Paenibacillus sp. M.A.Huq-81]